MSVSRKDFIAANAVAGAAAFIAAETPAAVAANAAKSAPPLAFDPHDPALVYDLVITGGTVVNPSQRLNAKRDTRSKTVKSRRCSRPERV